MQVRFATTQKASGTHVMYTSQRQQQRAEKQKTSSNKCFGAEKYFSARVVNAKITL